MDLQATLRRTEARLKALKMTEATAARQATGSPDTIRNWRRRLERQDDPGAAIGTVQAVAKVLDVPVAWLMGEGPDDLDDYLGLAADRRRLMEIFDSLPPSVQQVAIRQIAALVSAEGAEPS